MYTWEAVTLHGKCGTESDGMPRRVRPPGKSVAVEGGHDVGQLEFQGAGRARSSVIAVAGEGSQPARLTVHVPDMINASRGEFLGERVRRPAGVGLDGVGDVSAGLEADAQVAQLLGIAYGVFGDELAVLTGHRDSVGATRVLAMFEL